MAKLPKTFKKYEESRKRAERFRKAVYRKSVSQLKKASHQREVARNKRLREYEREKKQREKAREKEQAKRANMPHEPMTFGEFMSGIGFMAAIVVMFILFFVIGFWKTILLAVGLFVAIIVILVVIDEAKEKKDAEMDAYLDAEPEDRSNQIPYIKSLLVVDIAGISL